MSKYAKNLHLVFLRKEQAEGFQANLEKLRQDGTVDQTQYETLIERYKQAQADAAAEAADLQVALAQQVQQERSAAATLKQELSNLEVRHKVGELALKAFQSQTRRLTRKVRRTEAAVALGEKLLAAKSSRDVAEAAGIAPGGKLGGGLGKSSALALPDMSAFTELVTSWDEFRASRASLVAVGGGALLLVSVFLKWTSIPELVAFSGADLTGWLTACGILGFLIAGAGAFLAQNRAKGQVHIAVAVVALAVFLLVMFTSVLTGGPESELGESLGKAFQDEMRVREGAILYGVAVGLLLVGGILSLRES